MHILIIEDDPATSMLLHKIVRKNWPKCFITMAADPVLALDALQVQQIDLVLIDWGLPGMNGLDVLRGIRRAGISTVCVMITGHSEPEIMHQAQGLQVDAYVLKPIDPSHLTEVLSCAVHADA